MTRSTQLSLADAVAEHVHDGDTVALEGFTHLIPFAAGHEIIRQGRRDLTVVRMTPDVIYDQMIGMGCVKRMVFSYGGNPGVGSLHRMRDAVENEWPAPLELVEHSHAGPGERLRRGRVAAAVRRAARLRRHRPRARRRGRVRRVPVHRPAAVGRARGQPGRRRSSTPSTPTAEGNVMLWGLCGVQKEAVLAADRAIVTVEEIVDELEPRPHAVVLPSWVVTAVCHVPNGAWPSYAHDYSKRDNRFYAEWDEIARDRERFRAWMDEHVMASSGEPCRR